jgi:hypothetical protein
MAQVKEITRKLEEIHEKIKAEIASVICVASVLMANVISPRQGEEAAVLT